MIKKIVLSFILHILLFGSLFFFKKSDLIRKNHSIHQTITVAVNPETKRKKVRHSYDFRPSFSKNFKKYLIQSSKTLSDQKLQKNGFDYTNTKDFLFIQSKVVNAFDELAHKIGASLEYDPMLSENGIRGFASLDLYFNQNGDVDEVKSKTSGDHRLLRGTLVQAVRKGLFMWYRSDAKKIKKEFFKNQYFRADFYVSYIQKNESKTEKMSEGSYRFIRSRNANTCLMPVPSSGLALNLACVVVEAVGSAKNALSNEYKMRFYSLVDRLEDYDEKELKGIMAEINHNG